MPAINVFSEYVTYGAIAEKHPPIDSLNLRLFERFRQDCERYSLYFSQTHKIHMRKSSDYDGYPFEDFFEFVLNGADVWDDSPEAKLHLTYHGNSVDEYDYIAKAARDRSTAYKMRSSGQPVDTKFRLYRAGCSIGNGDPVEWFSAKVSDVHRERLIIDQSTQSLSDWSKSGLSMRVLCSAFCNRTYTFETDLLPEFLIKYGEANLSIEQFRKKLKCRKCGAVPRKLVPSSEQKVLLSTHL